VVVDDHDIQRFEDLLQEFDHAMLVSVARDGTLHARPMAIAESDGAVVRFATSNRSTKTTEVAMNPGVSVVMQGDGAFLAISGTASVINDAERIGRLWQSAWRPWFPEGPDDPNLVLLEIDPERAEYWDRRRARRLEYLWQAGKALATGRRVAEESLSGHGKFSFG
jgi:general stress protein 26